MWLNHSTAPWFDLNWSTARSFGLQRLSVTSQGLVKAGVVAKTISSLCTTSLELARSFRFAPVRCSTWSPQPGVTVRESHLGGFSTGTIPTVGAISTCPPDLQFLPSRTRATVIPKLRLPARDRTRYEDNSPMRRAIVAFNTHAQCFSTNLTPTTIRSRLKASIILNRRMRLMERGYCQQRYDCSNIEPPP